jgi:mannose-6-phosphate isomerase-like protein (cupin superfamily)
LFNEQSDKTISFTEAEDAYRRQQEVQEQGKNNTTGMSIEKINLADKFLQIRDHWNPRIAGELNQQLVKLVKFKGEFVWHQHEHEDELFLVVAGSFRMELRDRTIDLFAGEFIIIPRGVEHRPVAEEEVQVLLFEPATTLNTGDQENHLTRHKLEKL